MKQLNWFFFHWKNFLLRPVFFLIFFILISMPTIYCLISYKEKSDQIDNLAADFISSKPQFIKVLSNKNNERHFSDLYGDCDHLFCEKNLEALTFLKPQLEQLNFLSTYDLFTSSALLKKRLHEISPNKNAIRLTQTNQASTGKVIETHEKLMHSIELDKNDLINLLSLIESPSSESSPSHFGKPQLLVTHFDLKKSLALQGYPSYFLDLSFIKREPIQLKGKP